MDQEIVRFRANNSEQGIINSGSIEFELELETEQPMEHQTLSELWADMTPRRTGPRWKDVAAGDGFLPAGELRRLVSLTCTLTIAGGRVPRRWSVRGPVGSRRGRRGQLSTLSEDQPSAGGSRIDEALAALALPPDASDAAVYAQGRLAIRFLHWTFICCYPLGIFVVILLSVAVKLCY